MQLTHRDVCCTATTTIKFTGKVDEEERNSAASIPAGDCSGRSASIDMQWDSVQSLASTRHNSTEITSGELHGPWAPQEARMLHSLPDKQAGGDETIESLEILAHNDFVAVSSRIGHGYIRVRIRLCMLSHATICPHTCVLNHSFVVVRALRTHCLCTSQFFSPMNVSCCHMIVSFSIVLGSGNTFAL